MSILPEFALDNEDDTEEDQEELEEAKEELPLLREFGIDFTTGQLTGRIVEGLEAVKVWLWLMLHTPRFRYAIFSWDHGHELEDLLIDEDSGDEDYLQSEAECMVQDAASVNEYITGVNVTTEKVKDTLKVSVAVSTVYGNMEVNVDV